VSTAYNNLADIYDLLQQDLDCPAWADYIQALEARFSRRGRPGDGRDGRPLLVDLGCGTGRFCHEMARRGYDPIGIDESPAMLDRARRADPDECLFLQQDISRFELYGTVDLIVCLLDTVNHLMKPGQAARLCKLCANYLNPGALFIFDTISRSHLSRTLGQACFFNDSEDYTLLWQSSFRPQNSVSKASLLLFSREADGRYRRSDTEIRERYYSPGEVRGWLRQAGLELVAQSGRLDIPPPAGPAERRFYVARRPLDQEAAAHE
jgi:2-polyprenyl-3-methyl-5-hydroxy-6-metoxy-1,4-benzoquinol methylase